jgi:hypothetical protein
LQTCCWKEPLALLRFSKRIRKTKQTVSVTPFPLLESIWQVIIAISRKTKNENNHGLVLQYEDFQRNQKKKKKKTKQSPLLKKLDKYSRNKK